MTVSNQNPIADSLLTPADSVTFDLTPNGALVFFQVSVIGSSTEVAIVSSTFQPGFEGSQTIDGGVRTVSFRRTAGWDASPFTVKVDWVDDGGSQSESWSYELANEQLYPDLMQPRNPKAQGNLIVTDNGVSVRTDVGWIDLVGFTVTDLGNGKVRVADAGGGGGGSGTALLGEIVYEAGGTGSAPSAGTFRADAIPFFASVLRFDDDGSDGALRAVLMRLETGNTILLKDTTNGELFAAEVSTVADTGTDVTITLGGVLIADAPADWTAGRSYTIGVIADNVFNLNTLKSSQINSLSDKATPVAADVIVIEDSAAGFSKKKASLGSLPAAPSSLGMGEWAYATGGGAPGATDFTANTDLLASVNILNFSDSSDSDNNFSVAFGNVKVNDYFVIRDSAGGASHGTFRVTGVTDNGTYWTFNVVFGNVAGSFVDGNSYGVSVISSGNVVGPATSTDDALAVFDGTTGKLLKDSAVTEANVVANNAKVTNANHTGDVTGATALTIANDAVTNAKILNGTIVASTKLSATGTKDATTFLRGDDTYAVPAGGGGSDSIIGAWEYEGDGFSSPGLGLFRVTAGAGATPSGITQLQLDTRDKAARDFTKIWANLGANNFLKLWRGTDWYIYQVTRSAFSGTDTLLDVTYITDNGGGAWTATDEFDVAVITTSLLTPFRFEWSGEVTLPANTTDWVTYSLAGYNSPTLNRNIGTSVTAGLTNNWWAQRFPIAGRLTLGIVRVRASDGTGGNIDLQIWKQSKVNASTSVTNNQMQSSIIPSPISGNTTNLTIASLTSPQFNANDYIGIACRRSASTSPQNLQLEIVIQGAFTG